ncbi:unnamed protein product [Effrenium voratum]|nr:unnamed protein product [Effrenium voratum]
MALPPRRGGSVLLLAAAAVLSSFRVPPDFVSARPRTPRAPAVAAEAKVDDIVEELKTLTLTEAADLVKAIEETFGVDASASAGAVVMAPPGGGGEAEEAAPEKTERPDGSKGLKWTRGVSHG